MLLKQIQKNAGAIGSASHAFLRDSALGTPPSRRQAVIKDMHEAFRTHFVQKLQYNSVCRRNAGAPRALHLIRHIYRHDSHFRLHPKNAAGWTKK